MTDLSPECSDNEMPSIDCENISNGTLENIKQREIMETAEADIVEEDEPPLDKEEADEEEEEEEDEVEDGDDENLSNIEGRGKDNPEARNDSAEASDSAEEDDDMEVEDDDSKSSKENGDQDQESEGTGQNDEMDQEESAEDEDNEEENNNDKRSAGSARSIQSKEDSELSENGNTNTSDSDSMLPRKRRRQGSLGHEVEPAKKIIKKNSKEPLAGATTEKHDKYCWVCHKEGVCIYCKSCPRSYHMKCISMPESAEPVEGENSNRACICPECVVVMNAENVEFRSEAMKMLSMEELMSMLKYICTRMKNTPGSEPFLQPVQPEEAFDYYDFIVYPMDISTLEKNVKDRQYGSTEAFLSDAQWLVHNSIVFNSSSSSYTATAKRLLKVCKQELTEIETCPECYTNAHTKPETWFVEACPLYVQFNPCKNEFQRRPHILVWAKLKGFPFWPAKAMKVKDEQIDVRFFGQHDRAWIHAKDCYFYSEEMPTAPPKKNATLQVALEELNAHVKNLEATHGPVKFCSIKTPLGNSLGTDKIRVMMPEYKPQDLERNEDSKKAIKLKSKSPMTIRISSLKTHPKIVSNNVADEANSNSNDKADISETVEKEHEKAMDVPTVENKEFEENIKEEDLDADPPTGEILANALGVKRAIRKPSKEEDNERAVAKLKGNGAAQAPASSAHKPATVISIKSDTELLDAEQNSPSCPTTEEPTALTKTTTNNPSKLLPLILPKGVQVVATNSKPKVSISRTSNNLSSSNLRVKEDGKPVNRFTKATVANSSRFNISGNSRPIQRQLLSKASKAGQLPGGITLPGGNITVTPLSSSSSSSVPGSSVESIHLRDIHDNSSARKADIASTSSNIVSISANPMNSTTVRVAGGKSGANTSKKNMIITIPPSINTHLQNLTRTMSDLIRTTVEQIVIDMVESGSSAQPSAMPTNKTEVKTLQKDMEKMQAKFNKELTDMKHNTDIAMRDLRMTLENEKKRAINEVRRQMTEDRHKAVEDAKKKQWCANCGREALFYCCWNTSYCGYPCQEEHWPSHMSGCSQNSASK